MTILTITEYSNDIVEVATKETVVVIADFDTGAGAIPISTLSAKGSLISASAANTLRELSVGTDGQYLSADSSEVSGLKWVTPADMYELIKGETPGGRLTLATGAPDILTDQTNKTTLYYTPYLSDTIALFDGAAWNIFTFSELSLSLTGLTVGKPYDIFIYNNSGTLTLEALVWTNDTTRATALTRQNGILVKTGALTRRYLGTVYIDSAGAYTQDQATTRYVWNMYNRVLKYIYQRADITKSRYFVIGNPAGQYVRFGAGASFNGTASAMLYLRSTVEPLGTPPYSSEAGTQHADSNIHGASQVEVGAFSAGRNYIGMEKGGAGTLSNGHVWAEIWC